jgi:hypothetical protein
MQKVAFLFMILMISRSDIFSQNRYRTIDGIVYKYDYPGDNQYLYGIKNNEWYTLNLKTNKTTNINHNPDYESTIQKLDARYPSARNKGDMSGEQNIRFIYEYPGDKAYLYGVKNKRWYAKNRQTYKIFLISGVPEYHSTVNKLDEMFPEAR